MSDRRAVPPSAAGDLEPYGARIFLGALPPGFALEPFLQALLEQIAARCVEEGAGVIGHLKCVLQSDRTSLRCNLTSLRSGARCAPGPDPSARVTSATEDTGVPGATLDLAVLVYGLPAEAIDELVEEALASLLHPQGIPWGKQAAC